MMVNLGLVDPIALPTLPGWWFFATPLKNGVRQLG
jgi:hypothetical protein